MRGVGGHARGDGPRRALAGVAVLLVATGAACGFSEKRALARRVAAAPEAIAKAKTAAITLQQTVRVVSRPSDVRQLGGNNNSNASTPASAPAGGAASGGLVGSLAGQAAAQGGKADRRFLFTGTVDTTHEAVALSTRLPGGGEPVPFQVYAGLSMYQHRFTDKGAPTTEGRVWAKLDLANLAERDDRQGPDGVGANVLNPAILIRLLDGTLEGSIKPKGRASIAGVPTTRYDLNVDTERAYEHLDERRAEALSVGLQLMGMARRVSDQVPSVVIPARVWLDDAALPRRIEYRFRQTRRRHDVLELKVRMDLAAFGEPAPLALPTKDQIAEVDGVVSLATAAGPFGGATLTATGGNR